MSAMGVKGREETDVLMLNMLEKLELAVCTLAEYVNAKGLHDLLDRDRGASRLVLGGADARWFGWEREVGRER